tara:strand:- start:396 stop:638 length:243 start_codon:yes stop_codon:yes gene_type:complete
MTGCGSLPGIPYPENSTTERSTERKVLKNAINYTKCTAKKTNCGRMNFTHAMNKHSNKKHVSDSSDFTRYKKLMANKIMH